MRKWLLLALAIVVVDQIVKYVIVQKFVLHETLYVTSFFNLVRVHNSGAAFSLLADAGGWQRVFFIVVAVVASVWVVWLLKHHPQQRLFCLALALILGGAIGNLIDRVLFGYVVDFVQVHYGGWYFPAFNVADAAISVGAALLIWDGFFPSKPQPATAADKT
ncbi:MAG: lipoprotein signal peptidase [Betaproteobacteria bacterium]|nr:lipoprotein signal peptidase [Betaproteobacteria bacterium]